MSYRMNSIMSRKLMNLYLIVFRLMMNQPEFRMGLRMHLILSRRLEFKMSYWTHLTIEIVISPLIGQMLSSMLCLIENFLFTQIRYSMFGLMLNSDLMMSLMICFTVEFNLQSMNYFILYLYFKFINSDSKLLVMSRFF